MKSEYHGSEKSKENEEQSEPTDGNKGTEENEKQTERNQESEKDFFSKIFEDAGQGDDRRNIYIQYRIVNNHGVMASDSAKIEKIDTGNQEPVRGKEKKEKHNVFSDERKRNSWLTENYEAYPMALMIAAAAFDAMPYMWVIHAADALYDSFENKGAKEEKRHGVTEILAQFGAAICKGEINTYTGKTPTDIIKLGQEISQETILEYIWRECPQLQDVIMGWLEKHYMENKSLSMSKRAGKILGQLACWDYHYFLNNMVNQIRNKNSILTDMMMSQVVLALDEESDFQDNINNLLRNWSKEKNIHYLLTGLFVCVGREDKKEILEAIISCYIGRMMEELQRERSGEYLQRCYDFFATGMRAFTFYRILIEQVYGLGRGNLSPRNKRDICRLFLILFSTDIRLARYEKGEDAIFVCIAMQEGDTGDKLRQLWQMVWSDRPNREAFYFFLAEYDKQADKMPGYHLEKFVEKAFGDICDKEWQVDICSKIRRRSGNE